MTELTPLERELLDSVNALQSGFERSTEDFRSSLKQAVQQQSSGLENWQREIERRLISYEQRQQQTGKILKELEMNFKNLLGIVTSSGRETENSIASLRKSVEQLTKALTR